MEIGCEELQSLIAEAAKSDKVKEAVKIVVGEIVKSQMEGLGRKDSAGQQKTVRANIYANTEKLLYGFRALEQHLANEQEYMDMAFKGSSGSVVRYQKNSPGRPEDEQILDDRKKSYERSLRCYRRVKGALDAVASKKGFEIIEMKYLSGEDYSYGEIAERLAGTNGFSDRLNEKTVRVYKSRLLGEISVILSGVDAI